MNILGNYMCVYIQVTSVQHGSCVTNEYYVMQIRVIQDKKLVQKERLRFKKKIC